MKQFALFALVIASITTGFMLGKFVTKRSVYVRGMQNELDYYHSKYKSKGGGTRMYNGEMINYDLRSFDGGKTWYFFKPSLDSAVIIGEAEEVYPGFVEHLNRWDTLINSLKH